MNDVINFLHSGAKKARAARKTRDGKDELSRRRGDTKGGGKRANFTREVQIPFDHASIIEHF